MLPMIRRHAASFRFRPIRFSISPLLLDLPDAALFRCHDYATFFDVFRHFCVPAARSAPPALSPIFALPLRHHFSMPPLIFLMPRYFKHAAVAADCCRYFTLRVAFACFRAIFFHARQHMLRRITNARQRACAGAHDDVPRTRTCVRRGR